MYTLYTQIVSNVYFQLKTELFEHTYVLTNF